MGVNLAWVIQKSSAALLKATAACHNQVGRYDRVGKVRKVECAANADYATYSANADYADKKLKKGELGVLVRCFHEKNDIHSSIPVHFG